MSLSPKSMHIKFMSIVVCVITIAFIASFVLRPLESTIIHPCNEISKLNKSYIQLEPLDPPQVFSNVTCVTALYNIGRHDRSFDDYKQWTKETLKIPLPIVVFCKSEDAGWIREARGNKPILIIEEDEIPLENLVDIVQTILPAVQHGRGHVEWVNDRYILTQFSKAIWMQRIIDRNPFQSAIFFLDRCWH